VLLARDNSAWPPIPGLDATALSAWLAQAAAKFERRDIADLCYAWLRAQNWIDAVVVGMENEKQLMDNVSLFNRPPLDAAVLAEIARTRPAVLAALLNPALWPQAA
jgi:aryl-alcohol dehydrogenase-like predicted oxidoreductase